jgi:LemA protein
VAIVEIKLRRILRVFYPNRVAAKKSKKNGAAFSWRRFGFTLALASVLIKLTLFFLYYNSFVSMQYDVEEAAAQVDTQLQRRRNIILNLSVMVMNYAKHEKEIFGHAADTRKDMVQPSGSRSSKPLRSQVAEQPKTGGPSKAAVATGGKKQVPGTAGDLEALLSKIFAIAERYPDLRLSENFQRYMDALVDAETKIAKERMIYNERANDMSTAVGKFPGFLFAKIYGFESPSFFEPEAEAREPPKVAY